MGGLGTASPLRQMMLCEYWVGLRRPSPLIYWGGIFQTFPKYEEPKYEEPKYEASTTEAPKYEAPKYEEPKYEQPKAEASKY